MSKTYKLISIRISPELYDKLKELEISKTECFLRGVETYYDESELEKLAQKHQASYIRVYTMLEKIRQKKQKRVDDVGDEIRAAYDPYFFVGKQLKGITVTREMVEAALREKGEGDSSVA